MQKFLGFLKSHTRLISLIALGVAGGCAFFSYVGSFPNSFLPVVSHLLKMIFTLGILGGLFVCVLLKKENVLKVFLPLVFAAWVFFYTYSYLGDAFLARSGYDGLLIAVGVFSFFVGLILLGVMILKILSKLLKPLFGTIAILVLLCAIPFFFLLMVLYIAEAAVYDYAWGAYFDAFLTCALPVAITFAYLPYSDDDITALFAKKRPGKEEATTTENPEIEEAPATEKVEEIDNSVFDEGEN